MVDPFKLQIMGQLLQFEDRLEDQCRGDGQGGWYQSYRRPIILQHRYKGSDTFTQGTMEDILEHCTHPLTNIDIIRFLFTNQVSILNYIWLMFLALML